MAFFESTRTKSGKFITIEWNFGEWVLAKVLGILFALYVIGWMAFFVPTIFLLLYFYSPEDQRQGLNLGGIVFGLYFLVDYHYGLSCWNLITSFFSPHVLEVITKYTMAITFAHLILLIFGRHLYFMIKDNAPNISDSDIVATLFNYTIVITVAGYFLATVLISFIPQAPQITLLNN